MPVYLAYGSNMALARIEERLGPCECLGAAWIHGYRLAFHKRGRDGSGKCDAFASGNPAESLHGVVYRLTDDQSAALDRYEGPDYERRGLMVQARGGLLPGYAYAARPGAIDWTLRPFDWYHAYVLHGALGSALPAAHVTRIRAVEAVPDPDRERARRNEWILSGRAAQHRAL